MNFRMENRELKTDKIIFCKLNTKDKCFFTVIYTVTIQTFKSSLKKRWMKKNIFAFNKKKHLDTLDWAQNSKSFSNCQATYQKELCLLFEKSDNFLHRANVQIGFTPSPCSFSSAF